MKTAQKIGGWLRGEWDPRVREACAEIHSRCGSHPNSACELVAFVTFPSNPIPCAPLQGSPLLSSFALFFLTKNKFIFIIYLSI